MQLQPKPKTTFIDRFDKTVKFYDFTYHLHKATYKGLSAFYKKYSDVERYYSDSMINLTKEVYSELPELGKENPALISTMKEIINCMQATSQLHFNYAERLMEVSSFYISEYYTSKKKKENLMKILKDRNEEEYNALKGRENVNRNILNAKEKEICKVLYQNLDKVAQDENERIHKIKQQTIIYFSLYKKVCQKQHDLTSEYNLKLVKQEYQVKNPKIAEIAQQLRSQYNQYGGQQLERKSYDGATQSLIFNRESLKASMMMKQRLSRVSETQNRIKKMVQTYETANDQLIMVTPDQQCIGMFDINIFGKELRRKYAREINGQLIRNIVYDMIEGYSKSVNLSSDQMNILQLMKVTLKVKLNMPILPNFNCSILQKYWQQARAQLTNQQYIYHLRILQQISKIVTPNFAFLDQIIVKKQRRQIQPNDILPDSNLNFVVKSCLLDILLDSMCTSRPNEPVLAQGYIDILQFISKFGEQFLKIDRTIAILILLRKFDRFIGSKNTEEELEAILHESYFIQNKQMKNNNQVSQMEISMISNWTSLIINNTTANISNFYQVKTSFLNYFKILLVIEKMGLSSTPNFNAKSHFYACIRCAGYNYLRFAQDSARFFDAEVGTLGQQRLKNIVQCIEELDYQEIVASYFQPNSIEISKLLGVGDKMIRSKLFQEFTYPLYDFASANLTLLAEQEGVDREGYILRLGIILAKLDIQNPQPITQYDTFFKVLKSYLQATEKDYDNMLEHSRKTQLWIIQQNAQATANCIDFCSLLYKPFQFLLTSLKQLERSKKTQYTKKYSEFIKLRLNTVLKNQIIKYINFLYESLTTYRSNPPDLMLKPKRIEKPHTLGKEQVEKEKEGFKQLTRRLFNLIFLKDQLQEMICDFLDPDVYKKIDNSIFNIDKVNKLASQSPQLRQILTNIKQIVEVLLANEQKIVNKIADITVFHFFSKIFDNLYWQEEKNAIEGFFANETDYKLSEHTFVKYQDSLEDWFIVISRNVPDQFIKLFSVQFSKSFFEATQCQILNSTKFKLPFKLPSVIQYLDNDVTFLTTKMKQKFFDQNIIVKQIKTPFRRLLQDMQTQTTKLANVFEAATLKNDKLKCRYILVILNLRIKDEKAVEFVKKYKTIAQN